jgi:hypothetical protein
MDATLPFLLLAAVLALLGLAGLHQTSGATPRSKVPQDKST